MKCKSRAQFSNVYIDAFQNCIEDIGMACQTSQNSVLPTTTYQDTSETASLNQSFSTTSLQDFRNKMTKSFEQCQLWPIKPEDYDLFIMNAKSKMKRLKSDNSVNDVIMEDEVMETDAELNNEQMNAKETEDTQLSDTENLNSLKKQFEYTDLHKEEPDYATSDDTLDECSDLDEKTDVTQESDDYGAKKTTKKQKIPGKKYNFPKSTKVKMTTERNVVSTSAKSSRKRKEPEIKKQPVNKVSNAVENEGTVSVNVSTEKNLKELVVDLVEIIVNDRKAAMVVGQVDSDVLSSEELLDKCSSKKEFLNLILKNACGKASVSCESSQETTLPAASTSAEHLPDTDYLKKTADLMCNFYTNPEHVKLEKN